MSEIIMRYGARGSAGAAITPAAIGAFDLGAGTVLTLEELKTFHPVFEQDVFEDLSMLSCVEKRRIPGAPAPDMVQMAIDNGRKTLGE